jgi:putative transposase
VPFYPTEIRLRAEEYHGCKIYFVTVCCEKRRPIFAEESRGRWVLAHLLSACSRDHFTLHAYCIMPDHIHVVVEGATPTCDLLKFVNAFKQRTGFEHRRTCGGALWQTRYYDHILRPRDHVEDVACYIWWNPVRAGLCTKPKEYPLSGSQSIEWMKCSEPAPMWQPPWKQAVPAKR